MKSFDLDPDFSSNPVPATLLYVIKEVWIRIHFGSLAGSKDPDSQDQDPRH